MLYTVLYHLVLTAVFLYVLICIYIKVKFQFWGIQPVFHIYDFLYWIYPIGVVQTELPLINKYVDNYNICVEKVDDETSSVALNRLTNFIRCHFFRQSKIEKIDSIRYEPSHNSIIDYFNGSCHPSYISTYKRQLMSSSTKSRNTGDDVYMLDEILGVFSARSLLITLKDNRGNVNVNKKTFPLYYCDNLCVHPLYRKKGIAPKLIQTQYYNLRRLNKNINTFLFKREGEMTAIVPLVAYESIIYSTHSILAKKNITTNMPINIIEINEKTMGLFTHSLTENKSVFDCIIVPEIGTLSNLIKTDNIFIYGVLVGNKLVSCYLFKYQYLVYNKDEHVIECIASINSFQHVDNKKLFFSGFKKALYSVIKKNSELKRSIKRIIIENTSHNYIILDEIKKFVSSPHSKTPCAFFLYNYISYTIQPSSCFIVY